MTAKSERAMCVYEGMKYGKCEIFNGTHCIKCGTEIPGHTTGWMNFSTKKALCLECGAEATKNQPQEPTKDPETIRQHMRQESSRDVCPFCDRKVASLQSVTMVNAKHECLEHKMCPDCYALMKAQFRLKCAGLWRPTPKPEVVS